MGLSLLIPVYNYNATSLVQELCLQLKSSDKKAEIIILDDGSEFPILSPVVINAENSFIRFYKNEKNEGRMIARQKLAGYAMYDYLLFLDCDSKILSKDYILKYFEQLSKGVTLVSGGRLYDRVRPTDCKFSLHWKYGTKREDRRRKRGSGAFMSNNFLIKKSVFNSLDFSSPIMGYGHEDTWWGMQFSEMGITCKQFHNPVLHGSLQEATLFIEKSEIALANLLWLEQKVDPIQLRKTVKIYKWYYRLKITGLQELYLFFVQPFLKFFRQNLHSCKPNLFFFDLFRLAMLIRIAKNKSGV